MKYIGEWASVYSTIRTDIGDLVQFQSLMYFNMVMDSMIRRNVSESGTGRGSQTIVVSDSHHIEVYCRRGSVVHVKATVRGHRLGGDSISSAMPCSMFQYGGKFGGQVI